MGSRRLARSCAMQILYEMECNRMDADQAWNAYWLHFEDQDGMDEASDDVRDFASSLVFGVTERREELDQRIQESSKNWRLNRMAIVDRNILRLAVFELLHLEDIPKRVSINEAIELGKQYGSEDSGSFINGVLDKISQSVEKN